MAYRLANPIWQARHTGKQALATGDELARVLPREIGGFHSRQITCLFLQGSEDNARAYALYLKPSFSPRRRRHVYVLEKQVE